MTWLDFQINYRKSNYELAGFGRLDESVEPDHFSHLSYWAEARPAGEMDTPFIDNWFHFASEIHSKLLSRGAQSMPQLLIENAIWSAFFTHEDCRLSDNPTEVGWQPTEDFVYYREDFRNFGMPIQLPDSDFNPLDPEHPKNERRVLETLQKIAGPRIAAYIHPQVPLDQFFCSESFASQRADFVLSLPNGRGLVIEPGDHGGDQELRDRQRDRKFAQEPFCFQTLRPENREIDTPEFANSLHNALEEIGSLTFLPQSENPSERRDLGLLAASQIHRIEACLLRHVFGRASWQNAEVTIHIIERDVPAAGLALGSFLLQQEKIHRLYGKPFTPPAITLIIHRCHDIETVAAEEDRLLAAWDVRIMRNLDFPTEVKGDLVIDVCITAGMLLVPFMGLVLGNFVVIRNAPPHQTPPLIPSSSLPEPCYLGHDLENTLEPFLQDFFRKRCFRDGQIPILRSILANKDTIGLLPTGGGKSFCYQLAGLLRPGTTIVVAPLIALMDDQVEALSVRHHITASRAIHSNGPYMNQNALLGVLESSCFVFIAPERLQRQSFRDALAASTVMHPQRISLVVIDEAHCVSMWGHDFRPAYLRLPTNLRHYCRSSLGTPPPILSLTGTASQLVLIDLRRILEISDPENIIRPETFSRKELRYRVLRSPMGGKNALLMDRVIPELTSELDCSNLFTDSYGIIFDYVPGKLWSLLKEVSPSYQNAIGNYGDSDEWKKIPVGFYTGSSPIANRTDGNTSHLQTHWDDFKRDSLKRFMRGHTRCLFGNSAVSVGIDNPRLRYIVNISMPKSLEDYYQQAGRAGRSGEESLCYLLFSENNHEQNNAWFLGTGKPESHSDVDNAAFWHNKNFPGENVDISHLQILLKCILRIHHKEKNRMIRYDQHVLKEICAEINIPMIAIDKSQRFLGYLIILGVVDDYTLEGMNTAVNAELNPVFAQFLESSDFAANANHIVKSLLAYYNRYNLKRSEDLLAELEEQRILEKTGKLLYAACRHLISFLYKNIEYQRKMAIRDITEFCRVAEEDEVQAANIIRDYFDQSRFSLDLLAMREGEPNYDRATEILVSIIDHKEAEQLFWETGRLLSETPRPDWSLIRACARIRVNIGDSLGLRELVGGVATWGLPFLLATAQTCGYLASTSREVVWPNAIEDLLVACYDDAALRPLAIAALNDPSFPPGLQLKASQHLTVHQLRKLNEQLDQRSA